jgi:hypothetical protein
MVLGCIVLLQMQRIAPWLVAWLPCTTDPVLVLMVYKPGMCELLYVSHLFLTPASDEEQKASFFYEVFVSL